MLFGKRSRTVVGALISAILIATLLAACGGQSAPQSPQPSTSAKASESSKPAASASPASKEPLKIGAILTLSGPVGSAGSKQLLGLQVAIEEINAAGGIMGRKVELIERDDAGDPTKARTAAQELVEKLGVTLIAASTISSPALAIMPYLTEQKVVNMGTQTADAANDPKQYPYGFVVAPTATTQAAALAKYPVEILKLKKIGILADSTAYGNSVAAAYKKQLEDRGVSPVAVEQYASGTLDLSAQLNNLKKAGAEAILSGTLGADSVRALKGMQSMGWSVPFIGPIDLTSAAVVTGVGPEGMKQVYAYNEKRLSYSDKTPMPAKAKEFAAKLAKKLNQTTLAESTGNPSYFYDIGYMLKWAVEKAQSTEGPKVAAALETLQKFDGVHAAYTFTKDNHGGVGVDEVIAVKADSLKDGGYEAAPGY